MPERYTVEGKTFTWTTEDGAQVSIPLRVRMRLIRGMTGVDLDAEGMFKMLDALIPEQAEALDDMDVNDFADMFRAWQREYNALSGASLGESSGSSS